MIQPSQVSDRHDREEHSEGILAAVLVRGGACTVESPEASVMSHGWPNNNMVIP
jgi:hypothetical protein